MNFEYLKTFLIVAEKKSFSKAAEKLKLSQPAISFQIKALEKRYGQPLIDRSTQHLNLTPAGEILLTQAKKILEIEEELEEEISSLSKEIKGQLIIGASTIPGEYILPSLISSFKKRFPAVKILIEIGDSREIINKLLDQEIDLGFVGTTFSNPQLSFKEFLPDELVLITHPKHPLARKKSVSLEEAIKFPFLIRETGSGTLKTFQQELKKYGFSLKDLNVVIELGSTQAILTAVEAGLGVSIVSRWAARTAALSNLIAVLPLKKPIKRKIFLVFRTKMKLTQAQKAFVEFVEKEKKTPKVSPEITG